MNNPNITKETLKAAWLKLREDIALKFVDTYLWDMDIKMDDNEYYRDGEGHTLEWDTILQDHFYEFLEEEHNRVYFIGEDPAGTKAHLRTIMHIAKGGK